METLIELNQMFNRAYEEAASYIGVVIAFENGAKECIINPYANFKEKQEYYNKTYGDDLRHRFSPGIRIDHVVAGGSFDDIQRTMNVLNIM